MAEPVIVTVHNTPPGAPDTDGLHLEMHADSGARLTVHLGTRHAPSPVPTQPEPSDWGDLSGPREPRSEAQDAHKYVVRYGGVFTFEDAAPRR